MLTTEVATIDALVVPSVDLGLQPVGSGGLGESYVRIPDETSPVVDAADHTLAFSSDQRGTGRPAGSAPDAGAVELQVATIALGDAGDVEAGIDAVFPVTVVHPGERAAEIEVATADETAVSGLHYSETHETLRFATGETQPQEVRVLTLPGEDVDGKTFRLFGSVVSGGATIAPISGQASLLPAPAVTEAAGQVTGPGVVTAGEPAVFEVSLSTPSDNEVVLRIVTSDRDAVAGKHYESVETTVTFAAGESGIKEVRVPTLKAADSDGRTFEVQAAVEHGAAQMNPASAIVTLKAVPSGSGTPGQAPGNSLSNTGSGDPIWFAGASLLVVCAGAVLMLHRRRASDLWS